MNDDWLKLNTLGSDNVIDYLRDSALDSLYTRQSWSEPEKFKLKKVMKNINKLNDDTEVFLESELNEIDRLINLAISRKKRGIVGTSKILQEEREKSINELLKD